METPPLSRLVDGYCRLLEALLVAALALMVAMVFGNVVLRYAFNSGITVSEEVSRWLFVWMTFLGAIVGLKEHAHLGTDMLVSRLGRAGKKACLVASQLLMIFVTAMFLKGSWAQTEINLGTEAPVTGAPMAVVYAAGVVFAASALVLLLRELWRTLTGRMSEAELVMVQESEDLAHVDEEARQAAQHEWPTGQGKQP
jgi:TRAP-type C4-dicarboxylate transport system permease small subunit